MYKEKDLCHICNSNKILRFSTKRLHICNKCLSIIRGQYVNIKQVKNIIQLIINETYKEYKEEDAILLAENLLLNKCGEIDKFILHFYKSKSYLARRKIIADKILEDKNNEIYNIRTEKYKNFLHYPNLDEYQLTKEESNIIKRYKAYQKFIITENNEISERPSKEIWDTLRKNIILSDGYKCNKCGKTSRKTEFHLHHIVPLQEYGTNHENNLVLLCRSCHQKQHLKFKISKNKVVIPSQSKKQTIQICPSCQNKILTKCNYTWTPAYCKYCDFEFEMRKNSDNEIQIRTPYIENMIILCPHCKQKLRIKCGAWLHARCPVCNMEFEVLGNYNKIDYEIRPARRMK